LDKEIKIIYILQMLKIKRSRFFELLAKYCKDPDNFSIILQMLKIKRSRFFELLAKYCKDPDNFSIQYERKTINQKLDRDIKKSIVEELKMSP